MRRRVLRVLRCALLAATLAGLVWPAPVLAATGATLASLGSPSSGDLVEHPAQWDGKVIDFQGEAVGEVMRRGDSAWLHLNDDAYSRKAADDIALAGYNAGQAVWAPSELAAQVKICGDYSHRGDLVHVVGIFHAACPEHGGDMDIHAVKLEVVLPGSPIARAVSGVRAAAAAALSLVAAGLWLLWRRRHRARGRAA